MKLVFATHNENKLLEIRSIAPKYLDIISLKDIGFNQEIKETAETLEGNALIKVHALSSKFNQSCFSEDTGLEVRALNNAPGVYTARYAGENCSSIDNIAKLLEEMKDSKDRFARFRTVIALNINGVIKQFEGIVNGYIVHKPIWGEYGFGYDPIFQPEGEKRVFAQMKNSEKSAIDHRGKAFRKMLDHINTLYSNK